MTFNATIEKEEISALPVEVYRGKIFVVDRHEKIAPAIAYLSKFNRVGFDTESRPSFFKNQSHKVALIQLATHARCYLFRLNKLGHIPQLLEDFLLKSETLKIGLSLADDFHNIRKSIDFQPNNFIDLQKYVPRFGIEVSSLQKIYAILFGKKISKRTQLTNWEADKLTEDQQQYAAIDAWACLRIYGRLQKE
ncbi:MAG: 3'-5' exonuclease domain-containing protein 2 [Tannerella sp.]|jgi:ribonuclease D|nr:3'-5' exonuclease domain-containing protein 2 [Tannerella sp.]